MHSLKKLFDHHVLLIEQILVAKQEEGTHEKLCRQFCKNPILLLSTKN